MYYMQWYDNVLCQMNIMWEMTLWCNYVCDGLSYNTYVPIMYDYAVGGNVKWLWNANECYAMIDIMQCDAM